MLAYRTSKLVEKGWGHEEIFADFTNYCGKLLVFKAGGNGSMHFHLKKSETFRVMEGVFTIRRPNTFTGHTVEDQITEGDVIHLPPGTPHQLICDKSAMGIILEVSTSDDPNDTYRIAPGDTQTK